MILDLVAIVRPYVLLSDLTELGIVRGLRHDPALGCPSKGINGLFGLVAKQALHSRRQSLLLLGFLHSLFVQLALVKERAEALVLTPFPSEEVDKGLLFIEGSRCVVENAVVVVLGHLLH